MNQRAVVNDTPIEEVEKIEDAEVGTNRIFVVESAL